MLKLTIYSILILTAIFISACSGSKTQVIIQDKFDYGGLLTQRYYISYKEVKTSKLGTTRIGKFDYENHSLGDTIYVYL